MVFVALGATTLARLPDAGVPYLVALLLAGLVMVPVGALVAIPAIRLSGLFLALATFGFGVLAQNLLYPDEAVFGAKAILTIERPEIFGLSLRGDTAFYFFVLAVVVAGVLAVEAVRVTRLGRVLRALADSPTAVQSLGINPVVPRVLVFCLTGFLAAIAGGLLGTLTLSVNAQTFDFFQSLRVGRRPGGGRAGVPGRGGPGRRAARLGPGRVRLAHRRRVAADRLRGGRHLPRPRPATAWSGSSGGPTSPAWPRRHAWRLGGVRLRERLERRPPAEPGGEPMALLEVRGLRAGYGRTEVLHGVDLTVPDGVDRGPPRAQRRREDHAAEDDRRARARLGR